VSVFPKIIAAYSGDISFRISTRFREGTLSVKIIMGTRVRETHHFMKFRDVAVVHEAVTTKNEGMVVRRHYGRACGSPKVPKKAIRGAVATNGGKGWVGNAAMKSTCILMRC
jgi:hypothetical protein